jgi:uncharacterized small protein (DUF1192 family)
MNQIKDIYKQILSLHESIQDMGKNLSDQADQITKIVKDDLFVLSEIKRHNDLIASMKKEIDNLKAEIQRQGESLAFLKQAVSH